ncbi:MAG: histidine kinase [Deltaproteobacteria bacterium]|nr:histidine kinase [Deltaproteobacteria bacterium]
MTEPLIPKSPDPQSATNKVHDDSILQKRITLSDLVELEPFREVMKSFSDLYRVGIKVYDAEGLKLVDVRVASGGFCGYLFEHGTTRQACTQLVTLLKNDAFEERAGVDTPRVVNCFSGLRYVVVPIAYEGDTLGRLIFGPYQPQGMKDPAESLVQLEKGLDAEKLTELLVPVKEAPDQLVSKVLQQLQRVVDVILFTSYRSVLTSQMHIESVTASYGELQEKNRVLHEANDRLQDLDKMKSNFLATVSHELRTPLTSVIGYSEMLLEGIAGDMNDEQREYVGTIMEKGESLLSLISQILDLSRIESGNMRLSQSTFDLPGVLKNAFTSIVPQAQKKKITLENVVDDDLPLLTADKEKIGQVTVNLLGNAVKFTPEGGIITLKADVFTGARRHPKKQVGDEFGGSMLFGAAQERFVRISVKDSGIGIPKEKTNEVFERFFQVDNTSTREYGGTGLGLSIVRSFIEAHNGDIWCDSDTGQGATFTVLIPIES